jgi:pyruvate/2-oxoglutarate dehydrogenase complex dihydrolipoamide acyltransferase (E2) component
VSDDGPQQNSALEEMTTQREYQEYAATEGGRRPATEEPDMLLDVPTFEVERINLEAVGLRAHVSLLAELPYLVRLSAGADVLLDRVKLELEEGVKAQALLKVRLEQARAILQKALDAITENPEILEGLARVVDLTSEQVGGTARDAVGEHGAVSQVVGGVGGATRQVGEATGRLTEGVQGAVARAPGRGTQAAPEEPQGEIKATPAAKRLAQRLGVDLSQVKGTGIGGHITVTDVRSAVKGE